MGSGLHVPTAGEAHEPLARQVGIVLSLVTRYLESKAPRMSTWRAKAPRSSAFSIDRTGQSDSRWLGFALWRVMPNTAARSLAHSRNALSDLLED